MALAVPLNDDKTEHSLGRLAMHRASVSAAQLTAFVKSTVLEGDRKPGWSAVQGATGQCSSCLQKQWFQALPSGDRLLCALAATQWQMRQAGFAAPQEAGHG